MKFFIVGKNGAGKQEVANILEEYGIKTGKEFSNLPEYQENINIDPNYIKYSEDDVAQIFEQNSYIYINGIDEVNVLDGYKYYRGISYYTYDNSDVMCLSPQALYKLNKNIINDHIVFVWLDNNRDNRIHRYVDEGRKYSFIEQEKIESQYDADFTRTLYGFKNSSLLYFTNEDPGRIAAIVYAIIKHPELKDIFTDNFN